MSNLPMPSDFCPTCGASGTTTARCGEDSTDEKEWREAILTALRSMNYSHELNEQVAEMRGRFL